MLHVRSSGACIQNICAVYGAGLSLHAHLVGRFVQMLAASKATGFDAAALLDGSTGVGDAGAAPSFDPGFRIAGSHDRSKCIL